VRLTSTKLLIHDSGLAAGNWKIVKTHQMSEKRVEVKDD
jgi:hypothetical protein